MGLEMASLRVLSTRVSKEGALCTVKKAKGEPHILSMSF